MKLALPHMRSKLLMNETAVNTLMNTHETCTSANMMGLYEQNCTGLDVL